MGAWAVLGSNGGRRGLLLLVAALTPVHPGAGRAPGPVDLPVVRDPQGLPYIRGSMVKGAIKSELARVRHKLKEKDGGNVVDCSRDRDLCCLLGGEVGEGSEGASSVAVLDLYPLAIPAPSYRIDGQGFPGLVYVTTASAVSLLASYAEVAGLSSVAELLRGTAKAVASASSEGLQGVAFTSGSERARILVGSSVLDVSVRASLSQLDEELDLAGLHPLYEAYAVGERLVVLEDGVGRQVLEGLMDRRARVRLDRFTKTVEAGGLWTEEYIPWGTLLGGLVVSTGLKNSFCDSLGNSDVLNMFKDMIKDTLKGVVVVGGKESVGAGLLRLKLVK